MAAELNSTVLGNDTFTITADLATLSDFAALPEVLFEFQGQFELNLPLPIECLEDGDNVRCQIPRTTSGDDPPTRFTIELVASDDVTVTATATSRNNPVSNDFDPTNNIDTLTLNP